MEPSNRAKYTDPSRVSVLCVLTVAWLVALLGATTATAYVVVLKDGTQIITAKEYERDGERVILTMRNGVTTFYQASDVDFERTDALNANGGMGGAKFIEEKIQEVETTHEEIEDPETLSGLATRSLSLPEPKKRQVRETDGAPPLPKTAAGYIDLMRVSREALDDAEVAGEIQSYLEGQGHGSLHIFRGVVENHPLLEVRANTESEVFKGIRDVASALVQIGQRFPDRVNAFDILFLSEQGIRGGQFSMTPEQAQLIVSGRLEPQLYFLRYVEF